MPDDVGTKHRDKPWIPLLRPGVAFREETNQTLLVVTWTLAIATIGFLGLTLISNSVLIEIGALACGLVSGSCYVAIQVRAAIRRSSTPPDE